MDSGSWWWIGRPGVLRFMGSQRVGHDWTTELNWTNLHMWFFLHSLLLLLWYLPLLQPDSHQMSHFHASGSPCWPLRVSISYEAHWRRSSIGHDCCLTHNLDPGKWRLLTASPVLQMNVLLTLSTVGAIFKAVALREQYVETIWMVGILDWISLWPLYELLRLRQAGAKIFSSCNCTKQASLISITVK